MRLCPLRTHTSVILHQEFVDSKTMRKNLLSPRKSKSLVSSRACHRKIRYQEKLRTSSANDGVRRAGRVSSTGWYSAVVVDIVAEEGEDNLNHHERRKTFYHGLTSRSG